MPNKTPGIVNPKGKGKSKPRIRPSIHKDRVNPADFLKYDTRFSCEDCTHFASETVTCTIGYDTKHHLKAVQTHQYELAGNMAFCRFIEIV
ncbi:hypothetical protein ACLVWU_03625 [Bdellovibrio sp. HCB290]|uniref:hypothetical protein n=1 Tax=Bdellovibrio sp. HCB290 TaxID=3394356 RepID=UPI0039B3AAC4